MPGFATRRRQYCKNHSRFKMMGINSRVFKIVFNRAKHLHCTHYFDLPGHASLRYASARCFINFSKIRQGEESCCTFVTQARKAIIQCMGNCFKQVWLPWPSKLKSFLASISINHATKWWPLMGMGVGLNWPSALCGGHDHAIQPQDIKHVCGRSTMKSRHGPRRDIILGSEPRGFCLTCLWTPPPVFY